MTIGEAVGVREMTWQEEIENLEISDCQKERIVWKAEHDIDLFKTECEKYKKEAECLKAKYMRLDCEFKKFKEKNGKNISFSGDSPSREWYENRYQSDCIRINQLQTALDVLIDKYAILRKNTGLS